MTEECLTNWFSIDLVEVQWNEEQFWKCDVKNRDAVFVTSSSHEDDEKIILFVISPRICLPCRRYGLSTGSWLPSFPFLQCWLCGLAGEKANVSTPRCRTERSSGDLSKAVIFCQFAGAKKTEKQMSYRYLFIMIYFFIYTGIIITTAFEHSNSVI